MSLLPDKDTIADAARHGREVSAIAAHAPDHPAIIVPSDRIVTYAELDARADRLAQVLHHHGLVEGDAVALLALNSVEWVETYLAALRLGLQLVPVNWHLQRDDIEYVVADSGARVFVAGAMVANFDPELVGPTLKLSVGGDIAGFTPFDDALAEAPDVPLPQTRRGSLMIYTSGTTGRPKGVRHRTAEGVDSSGIGAAMVGMFDMDADRGDAMLCTAPLYHSGPSRICCEWPLGAGVTMVLMGYFEAQSSLKFISDLGISHAFFVPTMFQRMLALPDQVRAGYDLSSLRFVLHGAGPISVETKQAMFDWLGPIIHEIYAASEGPGTWIRPEEWLAHPGSVGRVDAERLQIWDDADQQCAPGEKGTVWFRKGQGFEYHGDPEKTASTHDPSGQWYTVGDLGHVDADGYLYLAGRTAEVVISGGVNIYPARVDDVLHAHPLLTDGAAFGVADDEYGQVLHAVAVPAEGVEQTDELAAALIDHCRDELGSQMTPKVMHFLGGLPRSDAGKLYRQRLVEWLSPPTDT